MSDDQADTITLTDESTFRPSVRRRSTHSQITSNINSKTPYTTFDEVSGTKIATNMDVGVETSLKLEDDHLKKRTSVAQQGHEWKEYVKIFIAETIATALLMCLGCMGSVVGLGGVTVLPGLQSAFTFGFVVCSLISAFGHISGAHMNPAVTICFYMMGTIELAMIPVYFLAEIIGATIGIGLLLVLTPTSILGSEPFCTTLPDLQLSGLQAVCIEFIVTSMLLFVLLGCNDIRNADKQDSVPLKFAAIIIALSLAAGPYTGASLNPARSFAPALWFTEWRAHWVYWIGPITAGFVAPVFYQSCFSPP